MTVPIIKSNQISVAQPSHINNLNDEKQLNMLSAMLRNGANPKDGFLELTVSAVCQLTSINSNQEIILRQKGQKDVLVNAFEVLDKIENYGMNLTVGMLYDSRLHATILALQKNFFPHGIEQGIEEATIDGQSTRIIKDEKYQRAEKDFIAAIKEARLPEGEYRTWIHQHNADLVVNQHEMHEGAMLQIHRIHLEWLAEKNPDMLLLIRDPECVLDGSKRWKATTAKNALFLDGITTTPQELSKGADRYTEVYVHISNPKLALDLSLQQPELVEVARGAMKRWSVHPWIKRFAVVASMVSAAIISIAGDKVKSAVKASLDSIATVVQPVDESFQTVDKNSDITQLSQNNDPTLNEPKLKQRYR